MRVIQGEKNYKFNPRAKTPQYAKILAGWAPHRGDSEGRSGQLGNFAKEISKGKGAKTDEGNARGIKDTCKDTSGHCVRLLRGES